MDCSQNRKRFRLAALVAVHFAQELKFGRVSSLGDQRRAVQDGHAAPKISPGHLLLRTKRGLTI
jgi:hypothetical protein